MIAFSNKIYTALENIKGELSLRKFKKDHPDESTIQVNSVKDMKNRLGTTGTTVKEMDRLLGDTQTKLSEL